MLKQVQHDDTYWSSQFIFYGVSMNWSENEDKLCCSTIISEYVIVLGSKDIEIVLNGIKDNEVFGGRDIGSIRMRFQNIKALLEEFNIKNTLPLKPLKNVAKQTRTILKEELRNAQSLG